MPEPQGHRAFRLLRGIVLAMVFVLGFPRPVQGQTEPLGSPQAPILVGINRDYPPYEFTNARGEPEGFDVDLVRAVARVMGLEIKILPGPWDQTREGLESGRIHMAAGMLKSPERARFVDFSEPHTVVHYSLFVRRDAPSVESLEELRTRKILVERASQMHEQLLGLGFGEALVPVASEPETLRLLASGQQDAALAPLLEGLLQIRQTGLSNLRSVGSPVFSRELCFAVIKAQPELKAKLDSGLAILNRTGEYRRIYQKWFGDLEPHVVSPAQIARISLWIILPSALIILAVLAWNRTLRRRIQAATQALQDANHSLAQRERLLNAVIDSLPLMLFVKDPGRNFCLTVWNAKAEEIMGIPRNKILGKSDAEIFPPEEVAERRKADLRVLESGEMLDIPEETVMSPAHGPVHLHTIKVPVRDEDGRPQFLLGISEDITLFKRIEEELRRSQASLAEAQRIARMGSWELDHPSGAVFWSDELFRILGHEPGDLTPSMDTFLQQCHPEDLEHVRVMLQQVSETGVPITLDHRLVLEDGQERHLISHVEVQRDPEGRLLKLLGTSQDITERRITEDALRQTQRLESLGVLAGGIAHDFNNLLTAIMGNLNLAQELASEDHPASPYLKKIESTVSRASNLSRQMLAYSGRGTFIIKPLDLNLLIQEMTHLLEVSLSKKVTMQFSLDPSLPWIEADEGQVQQVVMNLVTNASEAIGDRQGLITLTTCQREVGEDTMARYFPGQEVPPGTYVSFEVRDTGCGMGVDVLARLFEPFFTTKFSGRGLGLSAMRGIIRGHKGGIRVESEPGNGSLFQLFFPVIADPQPTHSRAEAGSTQQTKGTILIADDEPIIRAATSEMFQNLGFRVLEAADGLEAIEFFRSHSKEISAVLLDLTMPRLDGREALREILNIRPDAKVILCSGYHEQEALQGTEARRVAGFLPKPYRMRELKALFEKVLANKEPFRP